MTRAITISVIFLMMLAACARAQDEAVTQVASQPWLYQDLQVGHETPGLVVTPVNQILTPEGIQVPLDGLRPQVVALSPDQRLLVTSGKTSSLIVIDPATGKILQSVELPSLQQTRPIEPVSENILKPDQRAQVSYTGLIFSPDGQNLFLSDVNGSIKVFRVHEGKIYSSHSIILPPADAPRRSEEIPSGLAIAADGKTLYVCGNLSNQLLEINLEKGETTRVFPVGVAPYDVVLADGVAIVSNWGGRRAEPGDLTGPAGRGTVVRVDSERHIAAEGSVTFIDLNSGQVLAEILTGLHASDLEISPDRRFVVCANAGSDNLSVIDIAKRTIIDTIWAKPNPSELFGATPNAITISPDGNKLYLANGTHNSIAVIEVDFDEPGEHEFEGLIPVGWFPGALVLDSQRNQLCVANIKGLPMSPKARDGTEGFNSHHYSGSLSIVPIPDKSRLQGLTLIAARNMSEPAIAQALQPPRENQLSRPVPERIGEPSQIKHVVYIIKENRTYDQVFGALEEGNGHSQLCIFGKDITPNFHKLAAEFGLLDNTYCAGILSADGHQWSTTAISTDYMEKSFAGFPRSYPDGMDIDDVDALAYSPAGFIWDNAKSHGVTMRNYGEFMIPEVRWRDASRRGTPRFTDCYRCWKGETSDVIFECSPGVESIRNFSPAGYVGWNMSVPDQYRADFILSELKQFESEKVFPQLTFICLPNDHTSGTSAGCPTPAACMADNDLALGRIVEGLSHSTFWKEMAIFVIEDDPQAGWDHVSGYRTTAWVISPWSKRNKTISTLYNTTSVLRTIEQILGLPPMNRFDASASPMFDCFQEQPDYSPYDCVPNLVPLDQMNPSPTAILDPILRDDALVSGTLNFLQIDAAPEDTLNRILWRSQKGSEDPYPSWAVQVFDDEQEEQEQRQLRITPAESK